MLLVTCGCSFLQKIEAQPILVRITGGLPATMLRLCRPEREETGNLLVHNAG